MLIAELFRGSLRRPHYATKSYPESWLGNHHDEFMRAQSFIRGKTNREFNFEQEILPGLLYFSARFDKNRSLSVNVNLVNGWRESGDYREILNFAPNLIEAGLLKVSKFSLFDKITKDKLPLHLASSGQQCMLLMFFGMAGLIKDGSLICIDEPEISLYPRWQAEFIGILQNAFSKYRGCHFLIATHSPQIVSGLISRNGFVADLEGGKILLSDDYSRKSADYQLMQIFHEPGFKNEYLIRTLLVILSKLVKQESPSYEDFIKLGVIEKIQDRLEVSDPVFHLFQQIQMLTGKNEKN
jgi:hypothetical protein